MKLNSLTTYRILILLAAISLYLPSFFYDFTYDDFYHVIKSSYVTSPDFSLQQIFSVFLQSTFPGDLYRPVVSLSLRLNYIISDLTPWSYHLTNIILHAMICVLIFQLLSRLNFSRTVSVFTTLIFVVNPIHIEAVANIYNRTELFAAFFGLISLLNLLKYLEERRNSYLSYSLLSLLLAFLSKESALTILGIIFILVFYHDKTTKLSKRLAATFKILIPYLASAGIYLILRFLILADSFVIKANLDFYPAENPLLNYSLSQRILPGLFIIGEYIRLSILPLVLSIDYSFPANYFKNLLSSPIAITAQLVTCLFFILLFVYRKDFKLTFGLIWFITTISLTCNLFWPIGTIFGERLAYLPSLGISLFLTQIIVTKLKYQKIAYLLLTSYLILLSILSIQQLPAWKNNISLFTHVSEANTVSAKATYNLGISAKEQGDFKLCVNSLKETIYRDPTYTQAVPELVTCSYYLGEYKSALYWAKKYLEQDPDHQVTKTFQALAAAKVYPKKSSIQNSGTF